MKCDKCIFAKEIDSSIIKCCNPCSDKCQQKFFEKVGGCSNGKTSTVGISKLQREWLMYMMYL